MARFELFHGKSASSYSSCEYGTNHRTFQKIAASSQLSFTIACSAGRVVSATVRAAAKVLVIEDDPKPARLIRAGLWGEDYEASSAIFGHRMSEPGTSRDEPREKCLLA